MADNIPVSFGTFAAHHLTGGRSSRAHESTLEVEAERYAAAERLGVLIERRERLVTELSEVAIEMSVCEEKVRSFE
jgi:hypothetical protein